MPTTSNATTTDRVDIIIGADSHVPAFYLGRALPGRGTAITAKALVFSNQSGPYTYHWVLNGKSHSTVSGGTYNEIAFASTLEREMIVKVSVFSQAGDLLAEQSVKIPLVEPEVLFYEVNPLDGLTATVINIPYYFINAEMTFRGEPYYFSSNSSDLKTTWTVDGKEIESDTNPFELTLVKTKETGSASIGLKVINTANYLELVHTSFNLTY